MLIGKLKYIVCCGWFLHIIHYQVEKKLRNVFSLIHLVFINRAGLASQPCFLHTVSVLHILFSIFQARIQII